MLRKTLISGKWSSGCQTRPNIREAVAVAISISCCSSALAETNAPPQPRAPSTPKANWYMPDDQDLLEDLWKGVLSNSPEVQSILKGKPVDEQARLLKLFGDVLPLEPSARPTELALTDPNLEPTYPVPGRQTPAYALPVLAMRSVVPGVTPQISYEAALRVYNLALMDGRVQLLADKVQRIYYAYLSSFILLKQSQSKSGSSTEQSLLLNQKLIELRNQLIELAGLDCVKNLDGQLSRPNRIFNKISGRIFH